MTGRARFGPPPTGHGHVWSDLSIRGPVRHRVHEAAPPAGIYLCGLNYCCGSTQAGRSARFQRGIWEVDSSRGACEARIVADPREVPFGAVRLADVAVATDIYPDYPDATDGDFHLVRRHFDIRAFGVNGITGNAGDELVEPHHERDDEGNLTDGHEELFAVMSGHAVFTVDGEDLDAPIGTLVFVRDPALIRSARATVDGTAILAIGGRAGVPFEISRWERAWFP